MKTDVRPTLDDMVFENRNRDYGSYVLRKRFNTRLAIGFFSSLLFLLIIVMGYFWYVNTGGDETVYLYPSYVPYLKSTDASLMSTEELEAFTSAAGNPEEKQINRFTEKKEDPLSFRVTENAADTFKPDPGETSKLETTSAGLGEEDDSTYYGGFLAGEGMGAGNSRDRLPEFPGGNPTKYIENNLRYPYAALKQKISGRIIVSFIVNKTGHVDDVRVQRGINPVLDAEAVKIIKQMPVWRPGMRNGRPVKFVITIPITFVPVG